MSYATNLQFIRGSGIGTRVVDENIGTGDNTVTSFDLDNRRITAGSYVLSYAAASSNDFTALTETTHYTLDKESGRILLTTAGKTALSTNILYGTYWYSENFSDTQITEFLERADEEIDRDTERTWGSNTNYIQYYDGHASSNYPTTDYPYQADYDAPDNIVLDQSPIIKINNVFFLNNPQEVYKFYNYDATDGSYTDKTTEINGSTQSPFVLFASTPAAGDMVYLGSSHVFLGLDTNLGTLGVDAGSLAITWEYYNGSSWTALSTTETDTGSSTFEASGKFTWTYPSGWEQNSVNAQILYWVRGRITAGSYSTPPQAGTFSIKDSVNTVLEQRQIQFRTWGELTFTDAQIPNGVKNIRVDYNAGHSTTPKNIEELSVLYSAVQAYIVLSGGSYDDATSYTLGSKAVTIGEVYVNIERVMIEFRKKINAILDSIGRRASIA